MKKLVFLVAFLLLAGFVFADTCTFSEDKVTELDGKSIAGTPVETLVGSNAKGSVTITDTNQTWYFAITEGVVSLTNESDSLNYAVTTDSCTVLRLEGQNSTIQEEYDDGNIKISGVSAGAAIKVFFAKIVYWIISLFT